MFLAASLLGACEKQDSQTIMDEQTPNRVITIPGEGKSENATYFFLNIGHDGRYCNGCVMYNGHMVHMNCMGQGTYCATAAAVQLQQVGADLVATTVDTFGLTSEDFFNMPARSLQCSEDAEYAYLNIPAQLVLRDENTLQFTFTGLSFSEEPVYEND